MRIEPAELATRLRPALVRLVRVIRQQRADLSVTLTQISALGTLETNGPMSPGELAALERVQPPSMTKVLSSLEELGFVGRQPHPTDGRQVIVGLTDAGRVFLDSERQSRHAWLSQRLQMLDDRERAALYDTVAVLDKLARL